MIPKTKDMIIPILEFLADGKPKASREIRLAMVEKFNITEAERKVKTGYGTAFLYANIFGWARTALKNYGFIEPVGNTIWQITQSGKNALKNPPKKIIGSHSGTDENEYVGCASFTVVNLTDESINNYRDEIILNYNKLKEQFRNDLLTKVKSLEGWRFEMVVNDLFKKMGYDAELTQLTRDGGYDVLASEDKLKLNRIYIQAKCFSDGNVGVKEIRALKGIVSGDVGSKGIVITTSDFSSDAKKESKTGSLSILLINGEKLISLMMEYGLGISLESSFDLYKINETYFDDLDDVGGASPIW
jgi:restriction system protein